MTINGVLYTEVLYKNPFTNIFEQVSTYGDRDDRGFYICWKDSEQVRIHTELLYSLVILDYDGKVHTLISNQTSIKEANELYLNGQIGVIYRPWFEKVKLEKIHKFHELVLAQ